MHYSSLLRDDNEPASFMNRQIPCNVPDGISGDWRVESFEVTKQDEAFTRLRAAVTHRWTEFVAAGRYKRLMRDRTVVMSNTPMEVETHAEIIQRAKGHVLLNGLGLGVVLTAILSKPDILSVTVVENSPDVIKLVAPTFAKDVRVEIVQADAFAFKPVATFNAVWHDIWDAICHDNLDGMRKLHRKYAKRTEWQGSWAREECRRY